VIAGIGYALLGFVLLAIVDLVWRGGSWWRAFSISTCSHCLEPTSPELLAIRFGSAVILLSAGALAARIGPKQSPTRGAVSMGLAGMVAAGLMALPSRDLVTAAGLVLLFAALGYIGGNLAKRFA
jgi:hypothetical protein